MCFFNTVISLSLTCILRWFANAQLCKWLIEGNQLASNVMLMHGQLLEPINELISDNSSKWYSCSCMLHTTFQVKSTLKKKENLNGLWHLSCLFLICSLREIKIMKVCYSKQNPSVSFFFIQNKVIKTCDLLLAGHWS